ncbi:MAG: N-acyl-D-amino-acid deacylase [Planctomycetaceae bacterium]|nr:N-acyl-D-amino-acid deacylase [Planctomycetaceae bacterium]
MFDIIIKDGTIIDGTGADRYRGDLGIEGDRITAIGDLRAASGRETIDATNKIVAPGFVDVHNHSDGWMLKQQHLPAKTMQGFTTEVLAADGISYAPVDEHTWREWFFYLRSLNAMRMDEYRGWTSLEEWMLEIDGNNAQNAMTHIPYANLRALARGFGPGAVDDYQMREIQRRICEGMEQGAVGLSTGLDYIVQCYSTTDELVEACSAMAKYGGIYVTHVRYKKGLLPAIQEAVEIGRRAGVGVHISHLKGQDDGEVERVLDYIDKVARNEVDFSFDVYPYQHGSTMLNYLLPYDFWEDGPMAAMGKMADPKLRARFRDGLLANRLEVDKLRIAWVGSKENSVHQGKYLSEYIEEKGGDAEEVLFNFLIEERLAILLVFNEGDDDRGIPLINHESAIIGTDGIFFADSMVHPRVFGSASRLLGALVRDRCLLSHEEAIYKLSGHAAQRFGLRDRSTLREGHFADVVVFDAETICERANYDDPCQLSEGMEHVLVNGCAIITDGRPKLEFESPLPGRFVRCQPKAGI